MRSGLLRDFWGTFRAGPKDDNIQSRYFAILKAAYFAENFAVFARNFPYFFICNSSVRLHLHFGVILALNV